MKINISHIPEGGLNLQFDRGGEWFRNALPEKENDLFSLLRADITCSLTKLRETVLVAGNIEAVLLATCSRCLEMTNFPLNNQFKYTLIPAEKQSPNEEQELNSEDLEFGFFEGEMIDLDVLLFEQIMLQIPLKILCNDACKGLCPSCGTDLNKSSCGCHKELVNERLAVLKKFKKEG